MNTFTIITALLRDRLKEILLISLVPFLIAICIAFILDNQYSSSATISPKRSSTQNSNPGFEAFSAFTGVEDQKLSPELKFASNYFYSYNFLSSFLIEHDLVDEILMFKKFDHINNKNILYKNSSSLEIKNLLSSEDPRKGLPELKKAAKKLKQMVKFVSSREDATLVALEVTHYSPSLSFYIANELLKKLDQDISSMDIKASDNQVNYINSMLGEYNSIETNKVLASILDRELTKKILASSSDEYAFMVLDPPTYPIEKSSPRRSIIVLLSVLLGLFFNTIYLTYTFLLNEEKYNPQS
jgi:LPS O-antigen subunit length determinant protein (WzzB/FepE family)